MRHLHLPQIAGPRTHDLPLDRTKQPQLEIVQFRAFVAAFSDQEKYNLCSV
jgi:hypothetical protein